MQKKIVIKTICSKEKIESEVCVSEINVWLCAVLSSFQFPLSAGVLRTVWPCALFSSTLAMYPGNATVRGRNRSGEPGQEYAFISPQKKHQLKMFTLETGTNLIMRP